MCACNPAIRTPFCGPGCAPILPTPTQLGLTKRARTERLADERKRLGERIRAAVALNPTYTSWIIDAPDPHGDLFDTLVSDLHGAGWEVSLKPGVLVIRPVEIPEGPINRGEG